MIAEYDSLHNMPIKETKDIEIEKAIAEIVSGSNNLDEDPIKQKIDLTLVERVKSEEKARVDLAKIIQQADTSAKAEVITKKDKNAEILVNNLT